MSLVVDICKRAGNFSLETAFSSDRECLGILGASGCGKSMTLKCIAGILTPDQGHIELNGRVLFDSAKGINLSPQARRVGYLFQNYALFSRMTVQQNIGIGIRGMNRADADRRTAELVKQFHLEGLENHRPAQLSGGQQQRTALARMLASDPDVLLFDEPFSALDAYLKEQLQFEMQKVLREFRGDVLMVTHSRDEIYQFCDSVVVLAEGRKVDEGRTRELFRNPRSLTAARLSGCKNYSRARRLGEYRICAEDWNTELVTSWPVPEQVRYVGIRAHDFIPAEEWKGERPVENCFLASAADAAVGPFETSVRMAVNGNSPMAEDRLVWWKIDTGAWEKHYAEAFPKEFAVEPEKVMPLL